jgi:hypothetical protein
MQESKEPLVSVLFKDAEEGAMEYFSCLLSNSDFCRIVTKLNVSSNDSLQFKSSMLQES